MDKAADELAMLGIGKSEEEVNRHIVTNLSSLYTIQSKSILSRPSIPRSEIDEIVRDAYVNDKLEKKGVTKALGVKVGLDPRVSYACAIQPASGAGTSSGSRGRNKRGGKYKQQQQQQQQSPKQIVGTTLVQIQLGRGGYVPAETGGQVPAGTGGQVPAMDWLLTDPPSRVMPPIPWPPVGNPTDWGLPPNPESRGQKAVCYRCHRPGHHVAECPISAAHMDVAVPFEA